MNCSAVQNELAAWLYGEGDPAQADLIETHIAGCPACRREAAGLKHARRSLDAVCGAGPVQVDVGQIFRTEAARQQRRARRWKWAPIVTGAAAAAALFIAFALRLEVRIEEHQLVLRWGQLEGAQKQAVSVEPTLREPALPAPAQARDATLALQAQLVTLTQLAQGLTESASENAKHREDLKKLRDGVRDLRDRAGYRMNSIERDVAALYAAVFGVSKKGAAE